MKYGFFPGCAYHSAAGYKESVDAVNQAIGMELMEIPDWNCCGATTFFGLNKFKALALAGRIFALAQADGFQEIVTVCNACFTTLRKAGELLHSSPDTLAEVNGRLAEEKLHIQGPVSVRHYLDVLVNDVPADIWAGKTKGCLAGVPVAVYYGCQLTRPWGDLGDPEHPTILESFLHGLGFVVVEHSAKTLCCGASHVVSHADACRPLISRIVGELLDKDAQVVTTLCPLCQFNLDAGQSGLGMPTVPVPYFSQLVGLALGLNPRDLGLNKLLVSMSGLLDRAGDVRTT